MTTFFDDFGCDWICDSCGVRGVGDIPRECPECGDHYILSEEEMW